jgi:hypothetical protein
MEALSAGGKPWAASPNVKSFFFEKKNQKTFPFKGRPTFLPRPTQEKFQNIT